jgi:hypothetical protein
MVEDGPRHRQVPFGVGAREMRRVREVAEVFARLGRRTRVAARASWAEGQRCS